MLTVMKIELFCESIEKEGRTRGGKKERILNVDDETMQRDTM